MVHTKTTWTVSTRITALAMNNLESQYDDLYNDYMNGHTHDTRYYTKTLADTTFYHSGYMGTAAHADADKLDGYDASSVIANGLPTGVIMWWYSTAGTIPTGWHACDGGGGTTDYRDHFILSAGTTYSRGTHYGAMSVTPTSSTVTIGTHSLTESEMPAHTHTGTDYYTYGVGVTSAPYSAAYTYSSTTPTRTTGTAGSGTAHGHSGSTVSWNSESNVPPYYAAILIQKTA